MTSRLHSLALPFFRGRYSGVGGRLTAPRPDDAPMAHAPGIDPDRILVFGNGAAVGWGVRSHDLALPGHLARQIASHTGRGVDVDLVADPSITISNAADAVPIDRMTSYDAVVLVIGMSDALRMTSQRQFATHLARLLKRVSDTLHEGSEVLLLSIHRPSSINLVGVAQGAALDDHARSLNAAAREVVASFPRVRMVSTPDATDLGIAHPTKPLSAHDVFKAMATSLAVDLAPFLDAHFEVGRDVCPLRFRPQDDEERLAAIGELGILGTAPEKRFDEIVERARVLLGTDGAAFSVVDVDRIWNKSFSGTGAREFPLRGAMCATTIKGGGPLIVPDVWSDERFVTHPSVRFYAGYPVETPSGVRIGALCVTDPQPRAVDSVDLVLLRELALAVQRELAAGAVQRVSA